MSAITTIDSDDLTVTVSSLGAEMQTFASKDGRSWLWDGQPTYWSGRSPILFPIVGKAPGDRVTIDGVAYDMPLHGFAGGSEFALAHADRSSCRYELYASVATRRHFPFEFRLAVEHRLSGSMLTVTAEVDNLDGRDMPFGFGFHPAFCWPIPGAGEQRHRIALDNRGEPEMARQDKGLLLPQRFPSPFRQGFLELDHALFDDGPMIFPHSAGTGLFYGAEDGTGLKFSFTNLPNLALWTKLRAPFLCVEPWHGLAAEMSGSAELADRPYSIRLPAKQRACFAYSVELLA